MEFLIFLLIVIAAIVFWLIHIYNHLQHSMQEIREGFSNLHAGLKKRQQLSGQIIEIASGYLEHEQITQLKVAQVQQNMTRMMMLAQSYPQLKADTTYQRLMQQLENLENDILARRENYNRRVKAYNSYRNAFPTILVAKKLSFDIVEYFHSDDEKFDAQAQTFARDDSAGLQQLFGSSKQAISDAASRAAKNISDGVAQIRQQIAEEQRSVSKNPAETEKTQTPKSE
jgi:LemA family protein